MNLGKKISGLIQSFSHSFQVQLAVGVMMVVVVCVLLFLAVIWELTRVSSSKWQKQVRGGREGGRKETDFPVGGFYGLDLSLLFPFHWPDLSFMGTPNCRGSSAMRSSCVLRKRTGRFWLLLSGLWSLPYPQGTLILSSCSLWTSSFLPHVFSCWQNISEVTPTCHE